MQTVKDFLKDAFFLVEAGSFDTLNLWRENDKSQSPLVWEQEIGMSVTIGKLSDMPVCISLMPVRIAGKRIVFWELTSQVQDYRMVEPFFDKNDCKPMTKDGRAARCDAMNFHNCLLAIKESGK